MQILTWRYRFTTVNFNDGSYIISVCWLNKRVDFANPHDWLHIRKLLCELPENVDDEDMQKGILINAELCGIKVFGIRVL